MMTPRDLNESPSRPGGVQKTRVMAGMVNISDFQEFKEWQHSYSAHGITDENATCSVDAR